MIRTTENTKFRQIVISKITSTARNSTTTPTSDPDLQYPFKSGRLYLFDLWVNSYSGSATPSLKYTLNIPTHVSILPWRKETCTNGTLSFSRVNSNGTWSNLSDINPGSALGSYLWVRGQLKPSADGTFAFQWAQNTSNINDVLIDIGSYLEIKEFYP